jgi:hypothetical protein
MPSNHAASHSVMVRSQQISPIAQPTTAMVTEGFILIDRP